MEEIVYKSISDLRPYRNNPRKNRAGVDPVAASIKEYGFKSPIQITASGEIINGHTRFMAAQKLGLKEVPCVVVADLTEEQIRQYRIIDNKSAEYSQWDKELLAGELADLDMGSLDFSFEFDDDIRKKERWKETTKKCGLKAYMRARSIAGSFCMCLYKSGTEGIGLHEIKSPEYVPLFIDNAVDYITSSMGVNLKSTGWCLMTTPRRRHMGDFHFATAICRGISQRTGIPFYEDAIAALNHDRVHPKFRLDTIPAEKNVILYDDIITTGSTMSATKYLLAKQGCTVVEIAAIGNN